MVNHGKAANHGKTINLGTITTIIVIVTILSMLSIRMAMLTAMQKLKERMRTIDLNLVRIRGGSIKGFNKSSRGRRTLIIGRDWKLGL